MVARSPTSQTGVSKYLLWDMGVRPAEYEAAFSRSNSMISASRFSERATSSTPYTRRTSSVYRWIADGTLTGWKYLKWSAWPIMGEWPDVWKKSHDMICDCSTRFSVQIDGQMPSSRDFFSTRYRMIDPDSQSVTGCSGFVWSINAGTRPFGLIERNSGDFWSPLAKSKRIVSYL